ncbi:hypothetical protein [Rhodococcus koreensis]
MSNGSALWKGNTWDTGWGSVRLGHHSELTVTTPDGVQSILLNAVGSAFVDAYASETWACMMGAAGSQVVLARREGPTIEVIAEVERIGSVGRVGTADEGPGATIGNHAVRFHPRPGTDQCLLAWEIGVALIDPDRGVVWTHVHGDPDQRVLATTETGVELKGLRSALTIDLTSGEIDSRERENPMAVDRATLAAWRQSIGR